MSFIREDDSPLLAAFLLRIALAFLFALALLHAEPLSVHVAGKLLADEASASEGRFWLDDSTPICAAPESWLADWLAGSVGHHLTVRFEVDPDK